MLVAKIISERRKKGSVMINLIYRILGSLMIIAGVPLFFMPVPFGALLIATGSFFLVGSSRRFAQFVKKCRHRFPNFNKLFVRICSKMPGFIQKQLSKTDPDASNNS